MIITEGAGGIGLAGGMAIINEGGGAAVLDIPPLGGADGT